MSKFCVASSGTLTQIISHFGECDQSVVTEHVLRSVNRHGCKKMDKLSVIFPDLHFKKFHVTMDCLTSRATRDMHNKLRTMIHVLWVASIRLLLLCCLLRVPPVSRLLLMRRVETL